VPRSAGATIRKRQTQLVNAQTILRLAEFDTPTIANGLELLGHRDPTVGYTGPDIHALMPELGVRVGIAVTARMDTTTAGHDDDSHPTVFYDWLRQIEALSGAHANGTVGPIGIGGTAALP